MPNIHLHVRTLVAPLACWFAIAFTFTSRASAAVAASMPVAPGSSAVVTVTINISTVLGSSSDSDSKTVAITGEAAAALLPNAPPFTSTQLNLLFLNFATTTFNFQLFCPFCQNLNVTVSNLEFALLQSVCSSIAQPSGTVAFANAVFLATGEYSTTGLATSSGEIDSVNAASFNARVSIPGPGNVGFDQLAIANQTFIVPGDQLPAGVNSMSFTVQANLSGTTMSGPFEPSVDDFDRDDDGTFDMCDCLADIAPARGGGDGAVDVDDLVAVILGWGVCPVPPESCPPDFTPVTSEGVGDGVVDVDDLIAVILAWGACP